MNAENALRGSGRRKHNLTWGIRLLPRSRTQCVLLPWKIYGCLVYVVIKRLELLENVLYIANIMSRNLCRLPENISHFRDRCQLIMLRKITYICSKNERQLTHWISQQMVYIITTQQGTTYITHTRFLPDCPVASLHSAFRSFPRQFRIHHKINCLCKLKSHFKNDMAVLWGQGRHIQSEEWWREQRD